MAIFLPCGRCQYTRQKMRRHAYDAQADHRRLLRQGIRDGDYRHGPATRFDFQRTDAGSRQISGDGI